MRFGRIIRGECGLIVPFIEITISYKNNCVTQPVQTDSNLHYRNYGS